MEQQRREDQAKPQLTASNDNGEQSDGSGGDRLGAGGWFALLVMAGFLIAAVSYGVYAWNSLAGTGISTAGWLYLTLGIVVTVAVGAGLMGLVFYSSRRNFDR